MSAPVMTTNAAGNLKSSASLAASGTTSFNVDVSSKFENQVQIGATFGTVAATAGLKVDVYRRIGTTPVADTYPIWTQTLAAPGISSAQSMSMALPAGRYQITLTNLDATNGLTLVYCTGDTIDSV